MTRVSANTTLFWKLFVPIFYLTIFGMLGLVILFEMGAEFSFFQSLYVKVSYVMMYIALITFMYFTIFKIKRVEMDETNFIATNYFKTYRYAISDIKEYHTYNFILFRLHSIHLISKGNFGKKIRFIPYLVGIQSITENYSEWRKLIQKDK